MTSGNDPCPARERAPVPSGARGASRTRRLLAALALAAVVGGAGGWAWGHSALPDPGGEAPPTVRLYAGGEEIAAFQGTSRRSQVWIPLHQIPRPVVAAVLAAEDRRFYRHGGIDLWAVLRAATTNLRHGELRQGGSTITQQLARSRFLGPERTWGRKLRESAIAVMLELRNPKDRILEAYLNTVYMGHDGDVAVHGLGAAARHFLGKDLPALRPDEAALLAAAIQAPNRVFFGDPARARARRDAVLRAMAQQGALREADAREAMARPARRWPGAPPLRAPYFADLAREEIARRVALPARGEVRLATTLDPMLQRAAESAVGDGLARLDRRRPGPSAGRLQAALVAIETTSGEIRA
ncbi:MAG TPA: transglycosylase domain-containing protein, partial [Candidatus Methylomirabilis sp.]